MMAQEVTSTAPPPLSIRQRNFKKTIHSPPPPLLPRSSYRSHTSGSWESLPHPRYNLAPAHLLKNWKMWIINQNDSRDGRGKIRKDKTGIRRVPYKKTRIKRRRKKKDSQNFHSLVMRIQQEVLMRKILLCLIQVFKRQLNHLQWIQPKSSEGVTKPEAKRRRRSWR